MQAFERTANTYDEARRRLIPCFDRFYAAAVGVLPEDTDHVLDLGAGTGLMSAFVRARFEDAYLHMVDSSAAMLAQARERFAGDARMGYAVEDYRLAGWAADRYDTVVSALSIHHLEDGEKWALFAAVLGALRPGGVFVNAEQILQSTPELEAEARQAWLCEVRALGATEEQVVASVERQQEDRCATVEDQLKWMREAGFRAAQCVFAEGRFAVLAGWAE